VGVPLGRGYRSSRRGPGGNSRIEQRVPRRSLGECLISLRMFKELSPKAMTVCTFRAHSWIVRLAATATAIIILAPVLSSATHRSSSGRPAFLVACLVGLGLLIPAALLFWDHQRGVHVREDGIWSVSPSGSRFLAWEDIAKLEVGDYLAGMIAVVAVRHDGTRVALGDTARWPYKRHAVEQTRDQLEAYREQWGTLAKPALGQR
jgi:hypothetical protein